METTNRFLKETFGGLTLFDTVPEYVHTSLIFYLKLPPTTSISMIKNENGFIIDIADKRYEYVHANEYNRRTITLVPKLLTL